MSNCKISIKDYALYKKILDLYNENSRKILDSVIFLYNDFLKKLNDGEKALIIPFICDIYHNLREAIIILEDIFNEYYSANIDIKYKNTLTSKYEVSFNEALTENSNYFKKIKSLYEGNIPEECSSCENLEKCKEIINKLNMFKTNGKK